jgi:hypothetical protein
LKEKNFQILFFKSKIINSYKKPLRAITKKRGDKYQAKNNSKERVECVQKIKTKSKQKIVK